MPFPGIGFLLFFARFLRAIWSGLKDPEFRGLLGLVILLLLTGTAVYHNLEGWSWLDSFYFSLITLSTVGYGDFSPQTAAGKIFTMGYIVVGLGVLSSFILMVAERQFNAHLFFRRGETVASAPETADE